ncbi:MAG: type I-B CRISPR-associated endonuclease Cas1b [Saprospiraceae bacterium]|nr:type I-B CRISPR-associated endonuclease Cas1b [Saprospiraceae bacterium]MDW8484876.1 type I-B CRISPR-associated endonuclease Cas1b [Saprospiraceae bacterium]
MKKTYYLFNPGRMERKDNTLCLTPRNERGEEMPSKYLPIEGIESLYIFGSVDANSALFNFLGKHGVSVHFFDYYEHYTGSFQPREYLLAGKVHIEQTRAYLDPTVRMHLARGFVEGAVANMLRNLSYYAGRGRPLEAYIEAIDSYRKKIDAATTVAELMGLEGNCRQTYYDAFNHIVEGFAMDGRTKQPPANELNAMTSLGNMLCYTRALDALYHTQLNPTISFLHEPGARRYSLALDIAEVFKPILVDRTIFALVNKREIQPKHFERSLNGCLLNKTGREIFLRAFDERLKETIHHRVLRKKVSYQYLLRLECYKILKYILKAAPAYKPFKMWW